MQDRRLLVLTLLTAAAVATAAGLLWREYRSSVGREVAREPFFPVLIASPEAAERIVLQTADYELSLRREGDAWLAETLGGYPVLPAAVARLVSSLALMRYYEPKTADPALYSMIGVQDPSMGPGSSTHVAIKGRDGAILADSIVGQPSASIGFSPLGGTFVRRSGEARAWLVEGRLALPEARGDWFEPIVNVQGPEVRRVSVLEGERMLFDASKQDDQARTYRLDFLDGAFAVPGAVANDSAIKKMALGILETRFEDVRPDNEFDASVEPRVVRFETEDGMTLELEFVALDGPWVRYRATGAPDSAAGSLAGEIERHTGDWVFLLPEHRAAPLRVEISDLVRAEPLSAAQ